MSNVVTIDCFHDHDDIAFYRKGYAVVAVDVVRATTTAITAVASGRRCFLVPSVSAAFSLAHRLPSVLLAGEQGGMIPPGFHINNSPAHVASRSDIDRPLILLSSSGTRLCCAAARCEATFLACLRNYVAAARYLAIHFPAIALIGAGTRNEFREEDQMCCALIAECLFGLGYQPADRGTMDLVKRWSRQPFNAWVGNKSTRFLRESGQLADLEFILGHVADVHVAFALKGGEVVMADRPEDDRTARPQENDL